MVFYIPVTLVALQIALSFLSWAAPCRVSLAILAALSAAGCFYLTGFVLQTPWLFTWQVVLWLALGGVQLSYVLFSLFGGKNLWKIGTIAQPLLLPFMSLAVVGALKTPAESMLVEGTWLQSHVVSAIVANGVFAMAGVFAFAIMTRQAYLKARATSAFVEKLPPLEILEKAQTAALYIGAVFLAVSVVAGAVATHEAYGQWFVAGLKNFSALIMLLLVVALIAGKQVCGVRGRHGAQVMLGIYFLMLMTLLFTTVVKF